MKILLLLLPLLTLFFTGCIIEVPQNCTNNTIYINNTVIEFVNITRNVTINNTVYVDKIIYINNTINKTVYVDRIIYVNVTKNVTVNNTIYVDRIVYVNNTVYVNRSVIVYVDRPVYYQPENYINVTIWSIECDRGAQVMMSYDSNTHLYNIGYSSAYNSSKKYVMNITCNYNNRTVLGGW